LWIKTDIGPDNERNITKIGPEQSFTVPPGVTHEFRTGAEPTIIEEIAYVEYDSHDIDRKLLGGNLNEPEAVVERVREYNEPTLQPLEGIELQYTGEGG
jgi:D-lyxose ketol-isomerase